MHRELIPAGTSEVPAPAGARGDRRPALSELRHDRRVHVAAVLAACLLVWIWRRPHQLAHPYVWDEESFVLRSFLQHGWEAAFEPVQGYLVLVSSLSITVGAHVSFVHLPVLMYSFATLVFGATMAMLVVPESRWGPLRVRSAMALAAALAPTNPEVVGVLLYSFWWTPLWPLIVLGWRRDLWWLRAPALGLAALSSPAGGALFVLFAIEFARTRRPRDAASAAILFAGFVLQLVLVVSSDRGASLSTAAAPLSVLEQVLRTGGFYTTAWLGHADRGFLAFAGLLFLSFLVLAAVGAATLTRRFEPVLLALGALVFTALSAVPAPLVSEPVGAGPRYFFLPFVAFAWVLLQLLDPPRLRHVRFVAGVLLCASLLNLAATFSRTPPTTTGRLWWRGQLEQCAGSHAAVVPVPIYYDGSDTTFWHLRMTPAQCRQHLG